MDVMLCGQDTVTQLGWDYKFHLPFCEWWFGSIVWLYFTPEPENPRVHSELEDPSSVSLISSFLLLFSCHQGPLFLVPLTRKMEVSLQTLAVCTIFTAPYLGLALSTAPPGKHLGPGTFIPAVISPSFGFSPHFEFLYFSEAPVVVFCYFDMFSILISRKEVLSCVCHHAESGTCHFFL